MQMATHSTNHSHMWSGSDGLLLRCKGDGYHDMPGNLCRWYCLSLEHVDGRSVMTPLLLSTLIFILLALITIHDGCSCWQFGHLSVCLKISCDVAWKEITWMRIIFPNLILLPQLTCISQHAMICFRGSYTVLICSGAIFSCLNSHFVEDSGTVRAFKNHLISELTWVLHVSVL